MAGKAGPQFRNVLFMAFKCCIIFLMSVGAERGTFKTSTKIHSGLSVFVILCFVLSQAAVHSCFPLSTAF